MHWFFTKDSTIINTYFITNKVTMVSKSQCIAQMCWPKSSNVKWQTLLLTFGTHCIQKLSCLHLNKDLRAQKLFANFFEALITIHIEKIKLTKLDNYHKVTNKHISHLGKLDENMNGFQQK
jgi:hypothetical protein